MRISRRQNTFISSFSGRRATPMALAAGLALLLGGLAAAPASARIPLSDLGVGKLELSGNVQTTNLIRHRDLDKWQFIQQRDVLHLRVDWQFLRGGKLFDNLRTPGLRRANMFLLYRYTYDGALDFTPDVLQPYDVHGRLGDSGSLKDVLIQQGKRDVLTLDGGLTQAQRDKIKFQNTIREVYADLKLRSIPLSLRIGRQQIVWGESDFFRMLDRVNPLDVTFHSAQEVPPPSFSWDEIRRPLFMVKGLYDLGAIGPLDQTFIEGFWNPGDWYPVKVSFLPLPWGVPFLEPFKNPFDGAFNTALCAGAPEGKCTRLLKNTTLLKQGDYQRWNPLENSQLGVRFHGSTPQGIEFTLNYLHQRWSGDDGTDFAPVKALRVFNIDNPNQDPAARRSNEFLSKGVFPLEYIAPYINTFGFSANYADNTYTQAVLRLETIVDLGIPFFDRGKLTALDQFVPGVTEKNMWKGMLGFDRNVRIPSLNKKSSFFVTGQLFWHYLIDNPECPNNLGNSKSLRAFQRQGGHCLTGGFDLPNPISRPNRESFRDKIRDWEALGSMAIVGFYRGGSIITVGALAMDLVNDYMAETIWSVDWFVTPKFAVNLAQRIFLNPTGTKTHFGPWFAISRARSESSVRLTYQF